jgi:arylsulfatase A-like enzyme
MRKVLLLTCVVSLCALSVPSAAPVSEPSAAPVSEPSAARPNIVLILTDDIGYRDLGSYGAPDVKTPNIDSLAKHGTKLTQFYANASSCTPTRAGLITGRYQQRVLLERPLGHASTDDGKLGLLATGRTLPQLMKNAGYATGLFGKWHLGYLPQFSPLAHGFDAFFGFKAGYTDYWEHVDNGGAPDLFENDTPVTATGYMTDLITQHAVQFISAHARQPFFLEVAYNAAHWPYQDPDRPSKAAGNGRHMMPWDEHTNTRADYVKILERADQGVGKIVAMLDQQKLAGNTLVIFTNDNGGEWLARNSPFFDRKFSLFEGGIRVPAILRWPGHIPAGAVSTQVGITMDLTATAVALSGAPAPPDLKLEGLNLLPLLAKGARPVTRTLFWRVNTAGLNQKAVREGNWKLVLETPARAHLFDVVKDPGERDEVAASHTEVVRKLRNEILAWEKDVDAEAKSQPAVK